jgi:hypothetical protein
VFSGSDEGFTDAEVPAAMEYHRALVDELGAIGWTGGAYGLRKVMEPLAQQPWWPEDWPIWHWGGDGYNVYWWAWVKQWYGRKPSGLPPPHDYTHDISGIHFPIDENTLFKPMRFWSGYGADKTEPEPGKPTESEMNWFRSDDQIYWPGSATLPEGQYGPGNGIYFCQTTGGMIMHVTSAMWHVNHLAGAEEPHLSIVPGSVLGMLINEYGVWKGPAIGNSAVPVDYERIAKDVRQRFRTEPLA